MALINFEENIAAYIEGRLKEAYPDLTEENNSQIYDTLVNPMIEILKPIVDSVNRANILQDLSNVSLMTDDELDRIGLYNYGIARRAGEGASGYVYVEMDAKYIVGDPIIINPVTVATASGLQYVCGVNTIIRNATTDVVSASGTVAPGLISDYLNVTTGNYDFPIYVTAAGDGASYNVAAALINTLVTKNSLLTGMVFNSDAFTNGIEAETNEDYAARITESFLASATGSTKGYRSYIINNFDAVMDVYVAGLGNDYMTRDATVIRENGVTVEKSIGGKVDIYIAGSEPATVEQTVFFQTNKIRLTNPRLVSLDAITVRNTTNNSRSALTATVYQNSLADLTTMTAVTELTYGAGIITDVVVAANGETAVPIAGDELSISYISYLDDNLDDTYMYTQKIYFGSNIYQITRTPYTAISGIYNVTTATEIDISYASSFSITTSSSTIEKGACVDQTGRTNSSSFLLNPNLAVYSDTYYTGGTLVIRYANGTVSNYDISEYNKDTKELTLLTAIVTTPVVGDFYDVILLLDDIDMHTSKDDIGIIISATNSVGATVINPGDEVRLTYTYNKLVTDIQDDFEIDENRPITTDVLAREGRKASIHGAMLIKCKRGKTLGDSEILLISGLFQDFIGSVGFDSRLDVSDFIGEIYSDPNILEIVDLVYMPVMFFEVFGDTLPSPYTTGEDMLDAIQTALENGTTIPPANAKSIIECSGPVYPAVGGLYIREIIGTV